MKRRLLLLFVVGSLISCQSAPIEPMHGAEDTRQISAEENRLWHAADQFDEQLIDAGYLYPEPSLQTYVQGVMDRLYPEYGGALRVGVTNSPDLNAFALPNGSIYITTGMLARLDNESQMAAVLAHEGVHFTYKHSWQQRRNVKNSTAVSTGVSVITGVPLLGDLMAASSIYGFSRDLEREADAEGFMRLRKAGYDVSQAPVTFEYLLAEVEVLEIDRPYFFSTHPGLQERIDSFKELLREYPSANGYRGEQAYRSHTDALRLVVLENYLDIGQFQSVILMLTRKGALEQYPPSANYYLGEAYRLRGEPGDEDRAVQAYRASLDGAPEFAPPYRALGLHYMKTKDQRQAARYFDRYLELDPNAPDRAYIEVYRSRLDTRGEGP